MQALSLKFTLLVSISALLAGQGIATRNAPAAARGKFSGRPFPVQFSDVARTAGLITPMVSGGASAKKYIIEANGTGVALTDLDNDGFPDAYLVNGSTLEGTTAVSRLYRNRKGIFTDVTSASGAGRSGWGNGVCAGDFNNDGLTDLYVTYWGFNSLYRNLGNLRFEDVAAKAGVAGPEREWSSGCTFIDYDRDGKLDLFVTSYQDFDLARTPAPGKGANCEWKGLAVFCGPRGLPFGTVTLYHNRGDGTFEDVSASSRVREAKGFYAFTAVAVDFTEDGWPDLYVASDSTPSLLFRNNRDGTFSEIATETGVAFNEHGFEQGGMGIAIGDFNRDGRIDLIKTNFAGDYPNVYQNQGKGVFEDVVVRTGLAVNPQVVGWGVAMADLDNDGWSDVLQVNGHVYPELDAKAGSETYRQPRLVYRNLGAGKMEDASAVSGPAIAARHSSRGAAFADFDNDGDIDVLVMNMSETPSLLRNGLTSAGAWIQLLLEGKVSNRSAIGAKVTIETSTGKVTQSVLSQSSFLSQNDLRLHFGLGTGEISKVSVDWPNGTTEEFSGITLKARFRLVEGSGRAALMP